MTGSSDINVITRKKETFILFFVIFFVSFFLLQNYLYITKDTGPQETDLHYFRSLIYFEKINDISGGHYAAAFPFPPLVYVLTAQIYKLFGVSMQTARLSFSVFSIIFLLSMFGIGYEMGDHFSGMTVMALAASSPHVLNFSRIYLLDFPQTAMTALAFYLLIKTSGFKNRLFTVLFALALSLAFLTKWSTAFFILIPILWFITPHIFSSRRSAATFFGFLIPISVILYLSGTWFVNAAEPHVQDQNQNIAAAYLLNVLLPVVISSILLYFTETFLSKKENYRESASRRIVNFVLFFLIFTVTVLPWFYAASHNIALKFQLDMTTPRSISQIKTAYLMGMNTFYSFIPLFIGAGLLYIFQIREKRGLVVLSALNLTAVLLLFIFKIGTRPTTAYILSLIIFASALGGYWTAYSGKAKKYITAFVLIISFMATSAWVFIPGRLPIYEPIREVERDPGKYLKPQLKILCPEGPKNSKFNLSDVINEVTPTESSWKNNTLVFYDLYAEDFDELPFTGEYLIEEGYRRGKWIRWNFSGRTEEMDDFFKRWKTITKDYIDDRDLFYEILILQRKGENPQIFIDRISIYIDRQYLKVITFDIGEGYQISVVKIDKKYIESRRLKLKK